MFPQGAECILDLDNDHNTAIHLVLSHDAISCLSAGKKLTAETGTHDWRSVMVEGDFTGKRFNLYLDGQLLQDYIPMADSSAASVTRMIMKSHGLVSVDDVKLFRYTPTGNVLKPYTFSVAMDEDFEPKPSPEGWQNPDFNDQSWDSVDLPAVHGGLEEAGEDYFLRKQVYAGDFEKAVLQMETLDPGGEVWINGQVAAVINTRHPQVLDITRYLRKNSANLIAIRVRAYHSTSPTIHSPTDQNIGWFLGRTALVLTGPCMIEGVFVHTGTLSEQAVQVNQVNIRYEGERYFEGSLEINYYPWYPEEGEKVATVEQPVSVRPRVLNAFTVKVPVNSPALWTCDDPRLYRVEVILKDHEGHPVDDYMTTTGIRTLSQHDGFFYLNGKAAMLNGAQIMGFRTPVETMAKYTRCAPWPVVAEEMLMIRKMGANLLRMHVHAVMDTTSGINDPRYAELADQMGIALIWTTAGWTREGEAWNIDLKGYPQYMEQVFNHPSIVIWEASNHPNRFKTHDISDTEDFIRKTYHAIHDTDSSRLISLTTFWTHTWYANYEGTKDYKGNDIVPVPEYNAPMVTRGGQDAYSGYGADWSSIRTMPNAFAASCLAAHDKAYFNFEHEESTAQPNWDLCKGKPWYLLQSYEWDYDKGSIGRRLTTDEWKASQGWQAFSAWESMKKQVLLGYDGFSWCCLHGGPNMATYKKPLVDDLGHPKLSYFVNRMIFQKTWAGSDNADVVLVLPMKSGR